MNKPALPFPAIAPSVSELQERILELEYALREAAQFCGDFAAGNAGFLAEAIERAEAVELRIRSVLGDE